MKRALKRLATVGLGLSLLATAQGGLGAPSGAGTPAWFGVSAAAAQATSNCPTGWLDTLTTAINEYREDSGRWVRDISGAADNTLIGAAAALRGPATLPTNPDLQRSAQIMANKLADGTYSYDAGHEQQDGDGVNGPVIRAIRDGWTPKPNEFYDAGTLPPVTGVRENLFQGPANLAATEPLKGWANSPGHNFALLKAQAHGFGLGCAQNATNSYWVYLVETDAHFHETQENINTKLSWGTLYNLKPGGRPSGPAADAFEILQSGIDAIRNAH